MRRRRVLLTATGASSDEIMDLVEATRAGDEAAFGELYARYRRFAHKVAIESGAVEPEDAVSDAFRRTLSALRSGAGPTVAFAPYLATAVRSIASEQRRAAARVDLVEVEALDVATELDAADPELAAAFATLPAQWQDLLWQVDVEGVKPREVAKMLDVPTANAVSARLKRARAALRLAYLDVVVGDAHRPDVRIYLSALIEGRASEIELNETAQWHLDHCAECRALAARVSAAIPPAGSRALALSVVAAMGFSGGTTMLPPALAAPGAVGVAGAGGTSIASGGVVAATVAAVVAAAIAVGVALGLGSGDPPSSSVAPAASTAPATAPIESRAEPAGTNTTSTSSTSTSTTSTTSTTVPAIVPVTASATTPPATRPPSTAAPTTAPPTTIAPATSTSSPATSTTSSSTTSTSTTSTSTTSTSTTSTSTSTTSTSTTTTIVIPPVGQLGGSWQPIAGGLSFDLRVTGMSGESGTITFSSGVAVSAVVNAVCGPTQCTFAGVDAPDTITVVATTPASVLTIELLDSSGDVDDQAVIGL